MKAAITIYKSGREFLDDNRGILTQYPLQTVFFEVNATCIAQTDRNNFLLKLQKDGKTLIAVHNGDYPTVIFGDVDLCVDFARFAFDEGLTFDKTLGTPDTCSAFLTEYCKLTKQSYAVNHYMDIMQCRKPADCDTSQVETATEGDIDEITKLIALFGCEAMGEKIDEQKRRRNVSQGLANFALVRRDGKIVSFAQLTRETDTLCALSNVYTLPEYRCKGFSRQIVTYLTKRITDSGKLAYLFVDKTNPISNHLYQKIGYSYTTPQYEYVLCKD